MRVLLDTCVSGEAKAPLLAAGHDVVWVGDWTQDPGDAEILALAWTESRVVVTLDKDFGELAVVRKQMHRGIVRLVGLPVTQQGVACLRVLETYGAELARGALVTVEAFRVRVRPPD